MKLTKEQLHHIAVEYLPRMGGFATRLADLRARRVIPIARSAA